MLISHILVLSIFGQKKSFRFIPKYIAWTNVTCLIGIPSRETKLSEVLGGVGLPSFPTPLFLGYYIEYLHSRRSANVTLLQIRYSPSSSPSPRPNSSPSPVCFYEKCYCVSHRVEPKVKRSLWILCEFMILYAHIYNNLTPLPNRSHRFSTFIFIWFYISFSGSVVEH